MSNRLMPVSAVVAVVMLLVVAPTSLAGGAGGGPLSPRIDTITPSSGPPGTQVTLTGDNFGTGLYTNTVYIHYSRGPYDSYTQSYDPLSYSKTSIVTAIPGDAWDGTTAQVEVLCSGGYTNLIDFQVVGSANPVVTGVSPNPCPIGGKLTVNGSGFGDVRDFDEHLWLQNVDPGGLHFDIWEFSAWGNGSISTSKLPNFEGTFHIVVTRGVMTPNPRAGAGDVTVTLTNDPVPPEDVVRETSRTWAHDSIGTPAAATNWYLPEGSTANGEETWILVQNPGASTAQIKVRYITGSGTNEVSGSVPPNSRTTYNAADAFPDNPGVSAHVESNVPVVAEKAVYGNNRSWGHNSIGSSQPAAQWYLAEGCTAAGFATRVSVMNPNTAPADVALTYMTSGGPIIGPSQTLPANSRVSYDVGATVPNEWSVSTQVTSDRPVVAERAMFGGDGIWAHDSVGVSGLSKTWYLAEGCTGAGFETWVLVQNPNTVAADVTLTYMTPSGATPGPVVTLGPRSRETFEVSKTVPGAWQVSTKVTSNQPVVAERAMYGNGRAWATDSVGISSPGPAFYLAEGCTLAGFETWVLVQNPNGATAQVTITYMTPSGAVRGPSETLPANSRKTYNVAETVNNCTEVSTMIVSNSTVTAERAMYGDPK